MRVRHPVPELAAALAASTLPPPPSPLGPSFLPPLPLAAAENNALVWREACAPSPAPGQSLDPPLPSDVYQGGSVQHAKQASDKLLNKQIGACQDWRELRTLLHAHAQGMNDIHVSALVSRLAKVIPPSTTSVAGSELGRSSSSASRSGCGGNSHGGGEACAGASPCSSLPSSPRATPERRAQEQFMGEVSQLVSSRLESFDARALSNTLWAVAKLGFCPSHGLLQVRG